ncbi:hypothetical protein BLOT_015930, partial [Blomia tropicalis]
YNSVPTSPSPPFDKIEKEKEGRRNGSLVYSGTEHNQLRPKFHCFCCYPFMNIAFGVMIYVCGPFAFIIKRFKKVAIQSGIGIFVFQILSICPLMAHVKF